MLSTNMSRSSDTTRVHGGGVREWVHVGPRIGDKDSYSAGQVKREAEQDSYNAIRGKQDWGAESRYGWWQLLGDTHHQIASDIHCGKGPSWKMKASDSFS